MKDGLKRGEGWIEQEEGATVQDFRKNIDDNYTYEYSVVPFGSLQEGDEIKGVDGHWHKIVADYPEHTPEEMFEVETDSGRTIKVSGNHLWYVETSLDRSLHPSRLKDSRRCFSNLDGEVVERLWEIALYETEVETTLSDMIELLQFKDDNSAVSCLVRIAESIGPIAESNIVVEDLLDESESMTNKIPGYEARRFAQQILSLRNQKDGRPRGRTARSLWPVIVGRVVKTSDIMQLSEFFDVYLPDPQ